MTEKKLGVVYEPDSVPILVLVAAVGGRWPLVWIVRQRVDSRELARLRRFGEYVDAVGLPDPVVQDGEEGPAPAEAKKD